MPIPAYFICSESGATDQDSNRVSYFNVVEKLLVARFTATPGVVRVIATTAFRASVAWLKEEGDLPETFFEAQLVAILPNAPHETELATTRFQFTGEFQRLNVVNVQFDEFFGSGTAYIEARLRREGEQNWRSQSRYPIVIEELPQQGVNDPETPQVPPAT